MTDNVKYEVRLQCTMINSLDTLGSYIFTNQKRLGTDGLMVAKVLYQTMGKERGLSWSQIDDIVTRYSSHTNEVDYVILVAQGIWEGILYPDDIYEFIENI